MRIELQRAKAVDNGITQRAGDWWCVNTRMWWEEKHENGEFPFWVDGPFIRFEGEGSQEDAVVEYEIVFVLPIKGSAL